VIETSVVTASVQMTHMTWDHVTLLTFTPGSAYSLRRMTASKQSSWATRGSLPDFLLNRWAY